MDLLSISAAVAALTATSIRAAKTLHGIKDKFQGAELTITSLCIETTIISASLSQVQSLLLGDQDRIAKDLSNRPDLEPTLDQALTGCFVALDVLQAEIEKITEACPTGSKNVTLKAKMRLLWNETTMQDMVTHLRGIQSALSLLLQLLGT